MADSRSDWVDQGSDLALSSDEDDYLSSQSTTSTVPESTVERETAPALGQLHIEADSRSKSNPIATQTTMSTTTTTTLVHPAANQRPLGKPLQLLDLPLDVLKDIIKEITHTNDLTSLALTCSALHALTTPHMYSRFDIVWPESLNQADDDYTGVDALSYGLATLVMGEDVFHQSSLSSLDKNSSTCSNCGCDSHGQQSVSNMKPTSPTSLPRRGNHYAQYTRTFSIGNGPLSWVQDCSVNKEVGKMLGTLVALSVALMVNLESFTWDMPTGVVREIWLALASLADRTDHPCRLERVWVRWHDNSENARRIAASPVCGNSWIKRYQHVEHPSLSILPPLKSVTVLDIDEAAYVEELGVLINRSRGRLTELRIGIAWKAQFSPWMTCSKVADSQLTGWPRSGGVLSILTECPSSPERYDAPSNMQDSDHNPKQSTADCKSHNLQSSIFACSPLPTAQGGDAKLKLEVFELERVPLSVQTLLPAIDWTRLKTLSLMNCHEHENLWRALRRKYAPPEVSREKAQSDQRPRADTDALEFSLNIKHFRTDTVSPHLLLFIKDALAPNTLESVYLHEARGYNSRVQIEALYRHIIRKHRLSLRKLLIDATEQKISPDENSSDASNARWQKWMFNREMVQFVTSGRMPQLRELGMSMSYQDWHYFLQRLTGMPQLRVLYLPHIWNAFKLDLRELAMQVLDIVSIRPDLKIQYVALEKKCYQILEFSGIGSDKPPDLDCSTQSGGDGLAGFDDDVDDDDEDDNSDPSTSNQALDDEDDLLSGDFSDDGSGSGSEGSLAPRAEFRLQEILFYDDKISIFKARHGII